MKDTQVVRLSQASSLAKTISNSTAQSIIDCLSQKKMTASAIAKQLNLPLSTIHYNLKHLVKAKILDDSEFTYSEKGKTIIHYQLTNNIIIIVPQAREHLLDALKTVIPAIAGIGIAALLYPFRREPEVAKVEMARAFADAAPTTTQAISQSYDFYWGLLIATIIFLVVLGFLFWRRTIKQ